MGLTVLKIVVGNPAQPEVTEEVEFLIDSGAIYSVVPVKFLPDSRFNRLRRSDFGWLTGAM